MFFYIIGNCAQNVRIFACKIKAFLFIPQDRGTEGVEALKMLFLCIKHEKVHIIKLKIKKVLTKHLFHGILIKLTGKQLNIAGWSSLVARRAHNPKVMWFKSHPRNQEIIPQTSCLWDFLCLLGIDYPYKIVQSNAI